MRHKIPFAQLNDELHREWKRDRMLRQRVAFRETWRGCLGVAAMWNNVDDCEWVGDRILYSNDNLTWLCLRDIPAGHFPGSRLMNRRDVNFVTMTKAKLRYGMPVLDFSAPTREAWDFRQMPYGSVQIGKPNGVDSRIAAGYTLNSDERPREFAVLNKLSHAMTMFAFFARDEDGRSVRLPWSRQRPRGRSLPVIPYQEWFPIAYVGFPLAQIETLRNSRLWLACSSHELRLKRRPDLVYLPASVCREMIRHAEPSDLVWDTDAWENHINSDLAAAIFPPIRLRHWSRLKLNVGNTWVDARIGDPLFLRHSPAPQKQSAVKPDGSHAEEPRCELVLAGGPLFGFTADSWSAA